MTTITEPGLYDMPAADYHAQDGLSSTFARLLTNHVPAKALAQKDRDPTRAMEFGTLAHSIVLGEESVEDYAVADLKVIEGDGRTKAVKDAKAEAIAAGLEVVGPAEYDARLELYEKLQAMVAAIDARPEVAELLEGDHEVSAFWRDESTGVLLRARFDILGAGGPVDYKTTIDASRRGFQKSIAKFGYHQQADFYLRAVRALGLAKDARFRFIAQETSAPYLVNLHECDVESMEIAHALNDRAIRIFAECTASNQWPGYEINPEPISLPSFYFYDHDEVLPDMWRPLEQEMVI